MTAPMMANGLPRILGFVLLLWCSLATHTPLMAAEHSQFELGFGIATATFPDYRGSDRQRTYILPLPYVVYQGEYVQIDRSGIRGLLVNRPELDIDLSLDGAIPVKSDQDGARKEMHDLDPVFEFGPSINWTVYESSATRMQFQVPARAVFSTDLRSIHYRGWKLHPRFNLSSDRPPGHWNWSVTTGPLFGDRRYHDYYYSVAPRFVTPQRPAYRANRGYSGWSSLISASQRFDRVWLGAFIRYDNLQGASFQDSPLVETRHALLAGIGLAWVFQPLAQP